MKVSTDFKSVNSLSPSAAMSKKPRELKQKRKFSQVGVHFVRVSVRDIGKLII